MNGGIFNFTAVYLFVLFRDVRPGSQARSDVVIRTQTRCGESYVVTHAPKIDERFQTLLLTTAFGREIGQMKGENVVLVGNGS